MQADIDSLKAKMAKIRTQMITTEKEHQEIEARIKAEIASADSSALQQSEIYGQALINDPAASTGVSYNELYFLQILLMLVLLPYPALE